MAATDSVPKAMEGLSISQPKTKELKGVRPRLASISLLNTVVDLAQTEKRDSLIAVEKKYQQQWATEHIFEQDAPSIEEVPLHSIPAAELRAKQPKFFGCMP